MSSGGPTGQPACANACVRTAVPLNISQKHRPSKARIAVVSASHSVVWCICRETLVDRVVSVSVGSVTSVDSSEESSGKVGVVFGVVWRCSPVVLNRALYSFINVSPWQAASPQLHIRVFPESGLRKAILSARLSNHSA